MAPRARVIEQPREVHLHFHGVGVEDLPEMLARVNREGQ